MLSLEGTLSVTIHFGHGARVEFYTDKESAEGMIRMYSKNQSFIVSKPGGIEHLVNRDFVQHIDFYNYEIDEDKWDRVLAKIIAVAP